LRVGERRVLLDDHRELTQLVLPTTIAPARSRRVTTVASRRHEVPRRDEAVVRTACRGCP
jgi:hypothetical protein